jgi:hypothetical protein
MTEDEYHRETLATALRRTGKLRAKLERQERLGGPPSRPSAPASLLPYDHESRRIDLEEGADPAAESAGLDAADDDAVLLELLEESSLPSAAGKGGPGPAPHKKHYKPGRGRGRKKGGSRGRGSDPYGCHPDDADRLLLLDDAGAGAGGVLPPGAGVRAGRYTRDAGYTRPSYSGARGVAAAAAPAAAAAHAPS